MYNIFLIHTHDDDRASLFRDTILEEARKIGCVIEFPQWDQASSLLDRSGNAYSVLHVDLNKVNVICANLSAYPEIHLIMTLMSGFEILLGMHFHSPEVMYESIVDKIAQIDGVSNIETFICAETRKRAYALFEPEKES